MASNCAFEDCTFAIFMYIYCRIFSRFVFPICTVHLAAALSITLPPASPFLYSPMSQPFLQYLQKSKLHSNQNRTSQKVAQLRAISNTTLCDFKLAFFFHMNRHIRLGVL